MNLCRREGKRRRKEKRRKKGGKGGGSEQDKEEAWLAAAVTLHSHGCTCTFQHSRWDKIQCCHKLQFLRKNIQNRLRAHVICLKRPEGQNVTTVFNLWGRKGHCIMRIYYTLNHTQKSTSWRTSNCYKPQTFLCSDFSTVLWPSGLVWGQVSLLPPPPHCPPVVGLPEPHLHCLRPGCPPVWSERVVNVWGCGKLETAGPPEPLWSPKTSKHKWALNRNC